MSREADSFLRKNKQLWDTYHQQFQQQFGVSLSQYWHPVFGFDVVKFDREFVKPDEGTSTHDAVLARWGREAVDLIHKLIGLD